MVDVGKKIRYDEARGAEYVRWRGKRVYGSWNEMNPTKDNKVNTTGIKNHITQGRVGRLLLNEENWDKVINP
jgi:hypothetical protein